MSALWLFENLYFAEELPDAYINPMPAQSGFTWGVAGPPNPDNGHAFCSEKYDQTGAYIDTWGMQGVHTWAAIAEYASITNNGELYAVLSKDAIIKGTNKAPNGVNWTQLLSDLQSTEPSRPHRRPRHAMEIIP